MPESGKALPVARVAVLGTACCERRPGSGIDSCNRGNSAAADRGRLLHRVAGPLHAKGTASRMLQPVLPCAILSSGHDQDAAGICDPCGETERNLQHFRAGRVGGDGRSRSSVRVQPLSGGMLRERFPSMKFEVVNTGSVAINSHVLLPIARTWPITPDVFIIYSGNNEVVGPYGPGTALTASGMNLEVIRSSIFFVPRGSVSWSPSWEHRKRNGAGWRCFSTNNFRPPRR